MKKLILPVLAFTLIFTIWNPVVATEKSDSHLELLCIGDESGDTYCGEVSDEPEQNRALDDQEDNAKLTEKLIHPAVFFIFVALTSTIVLMRKKLQ